MRVVVIEKFQAYSSLYLMTVGDLYHDEDRTSPKSGPNTDEGFGTFTKTTPRGKDSASEGSGDHTDCEVDHLEQEPTSITEW